MWQLVLLSIAEGHSNFLVHQGSRQVISLDPAPARYHEQSQDHFDAANNNTWLQAYYVNESFWKPGSDAPIFLCVGGEGPALDASAVQQSVHCNIAVEWLQETKALMFALEHRYYGCHNMSACPVKDFSRPDALSFLSSRQAVEDIASFVKAMNAKYSLKRNLWVTWGGSYPGMLAGWSRLKHPELIHAAVASSAPVFATFDMPQYCDHMSFAYTVSHSGVGGSEACRDAIGTGHAWIQERFQKGDFQTVVEKFGLQNDSLSSLDKRIAFASTGVANFPAQENDPLCEEAACNIAKVCQVMTNTSLGDEVSRLVTLRQLQGVRTLSQKGQVQAQLLSGLPGPLRNTLTGVLPQTGAQLPDFWFYQTCKEFGFYQTCEDDDCMFVRDLANASYMANPCMKLFNITLEDVQSNIDSTNYHYGGFLPSDTKGNLGRCVMFPNGEIDPWQTCSVRRAPDPDLPILMVDGASHHAWTWPSRSEDQESVMTARMKIRRQVDQFLRMDCSEVGQPHSKTTNWLLIAAVAVAAIAVLAMVIAVAVRRCRRPRAVLLNQSNMSLQPQ